MKADMGTDDHLDTALRGLARADDAQAAPPRIEEAVMREWQAMRRHKSVNRVAAPRTTLVAMAASLLFGLGIGGWWILEKANTKAPGSETVLMGEASTGHSYEMLAWLDPDPTSLQIVRLRVASETLRTQGYEVSDPDGDGAVEIEMVLGSDGMARSVLVTSDGMLRN
jgi:hypothetical protein